MHELTIHGGNAVTMTSLELVEFINSQRREGEPELRHDNFMAKVPKVLGDDAPKFLGTQKYGNNNTREIYNFPKREACLMAMSYSYELQAKVFDHMTELEANLSKPQFSVPQSFADALRLAADEHEARLLAEEQRDHAIATKSLIGSKREASAMNAASQAVKKASKLEIELDRSKQYATVKRMEMLYHGQSFNWRLLKSTAIQMAIPPIDVFDANYGKVNAYHADVWMEAYAIEIIGGTDNTPPPAKAGTQGQVVSA